MVLVLLPLSQVVSSAARLEVAGGWPQAEGEVPVVPQDRSTVGKPNIILYVIDDLGFADLSLNGTAPRTAGGYARDHSTPNIDMLAAEGLILDAYYVNRLCSPTRTSLISSRFAYNLGLAGGVITNGFAVALRLNETCIAQHMKDIGYV